MSAINQTSTAPSANQASPPVPVRLEQSRKELEEMTKKAILNPSKINQEKTRSETDLKTRTLEQIHNENPEIISSDPRVSKLLSKEDLERIRKKSQEIISDENLERISKESLEDLVAEIQKMGTSFLGVMVHCDFNQKVIICDKLEPLLKLIVRNPKGEAKKENKEQENAGKIEAKKETAQKDSEAHAPVELIKSSLEASASSSVSQSSSSSATTAAATATNIQTSFASTEAIFTAQEELAYKEMSDLLEKIEAKKEISKKEISALLEKIKACEEIADKKLPALLEKIGKQTKTNARKTEEEEIANKKISALLEKMDKQTKTNVKIVYLWMKNDMLPSPENSPTASSPARVFQFPVQKTAAKTSSCSIAVFLLIAAAVCAGLGIAYRYMHSR